MPPAALHPCTSQRRVSRSHPACSICSSPPSTPSSRLFLRLSFVVRSRLPPPPVLSGSCADVIWRTVRGSTGGACAGPSSVRAWDPGTASELALDGAPGGGFGELCLKPRASERPGEAGQPPGFPAGSGPPAERLAVLGVPPLTDTTPSGLLWHLHGPVTAFDSHFLPRSRSPPMSRGNSHLLCLGDKN